MDFENAKNVIFGGMIQNYCCFKGQTGKIQLSTILLSENRPGGLVIDKHWAWFDSACLFTGRSKVAPRMKNLFRSGSLGAQ